MYSLIETILSLNHAAIPMPKLPKLNKQKAIAQYVTIMKECYLDEVNWPLFPREGRWPTELNEPDHYIELQLVRHESFPRDGAELDTAECLSSGNIKQILDENQCYSLKNLFQCETSIPVEDGEAMNTCVLVDGAPGVGKTTMVHKACKDWAHGELWTEYKLVVYVPLKDGTFATATEMWQLFENDSKKLSKQVAEEVAQQHGESVMFIMDGWDELSELKDTSVIKKILHRQLLRKCSLLVTSRPHASFELIRYWNQKYYQRYEAIGFTQDQITAVITKYFENDEEKGKDLLKQMQEKSGVMNLCYIPLNLAIVLHVYKQENTLPETLTQLYNIFMRNLLIHQLNLSHLSSLSSLPQDAATIYESLCKVAYEELLKRSLTFSEELLQNISLTMTDSTLGLLTAFKCHTSSGIMTKYQFTHLTIQEFLAAEYLAKQSELTKIEFIVEHINDEKYLIMLQFLLGITSQNGKIKDLRGLFALLCSLEHPRRIQILLRLVYETRREWCIKELGSRINGKALTVHSEHWSVYELRLLSYLIDYLQWNYSKLDTWGVSQTMNNIAIVRHQVLCVTQLIRQRCVTKIEIVAYFKHLYSIFLSQLKNEGFNLNSFELIGTSNNNYVGRFHFVRQGSVQSSGYMMDAMAALLEYPQLMKRTKADEGFSLYLSQGHCPHTLNFANMQLVEVLADTGKHTLLININSILTCIGSGLETLCLTGHMVMSNEVVALLFGAIAASLDLKVLDLSNNLLFLRLGESRQIALDAFVYMLTHSTSLNELSMKQCAIDEEVLSLFSLYNSRIKILNLDCTHEFPKSLDLQLLTSNLSTLHLSHCHLNDEDATRIGSMLCTNVSLKELFLDRNNITAGGAIHIFIGLLENKSLQHLSIGRQIISKSESNQETTEVEELQDILTKVVTNVFKVNKTLKKLSMSIFPQYSDRTLINLKLKIHDKDTREYLKKVDEILHKKYTLNSNEATMLPIVMLPVEDILSLAVYSSLEELDISGYNITEPIPMLSLINFIKQSTAILCIKLCACRLQELEYAPLQKQLFQAICNNPNLNEISTEPETASFLTGFVDRVNYERYTKGIQPLTMYSNKNFFELLLQMWNHS